MSEFAGRKMRTVIVEDNVDSLNKLKGMLADYDNIELVGDAQNVKDAVRMIERRKPDLLFLDIIMPGGDGFDVLEKINH
ncbi:MAG: response regulator, partial [Candidatus Aenigmarchaeota archaeon]|nr:response regulator [Candidatus Aenigmarchaeota archaeon]